MALTLTERAAQEVRTILEQQKLESDKTYLRMGVKGGGCSGFSYSLDLTESKSELDEEFDSNGVKVVCDPKSYLYLNGTTLDFKDEIMGRGFVFNNPEREHQLRLRQQLLGLTGDCGPGAAFEHLACVARRTRGLPGFSSRRDAGAERRPAPDGAGNHERHHQPDRP